MKSAMTRSNVLYLCGLILLFVNVCRAIKINSISVPSRYELKEDAQPLILDCDFTVSDDETGFVLKWMHNSVSIYQWIPSKKVPFALVNFKDRVDINYTTSEDRYKKHSALVISKPLPSDSGTYTCNVQTFQGNDKQSADLQIIDPEDSIDLTFEIDEEASTVNLKCAVQNIYPLPHVKLLFNNEEKDIHTDIHSELDKDTEAYDVVLTAELKKDDIADESDVTCVVEIPNSDYATKKTITYDDPKQSATTKKSILGELTKFTDAGATNVNAGAGPGSSIALILTSIIFFLSR